MGRKVMVSGDHGSVGTRVTLEIGTGRLARFARRLLSRGVTHLTGVVVESGPIHPGGPVQAIVELDDEQSYGLPS